MTTAVGLQGLTLPPAAAVANSDSLKEKALRPSVPELSFQESLNSVLLQYAWRDGTVLVAYGSPDTT